MIKEISAPEWGTEILEDTDTGELSIQCLCGGIAMYYQRIVLAPAEAQEFRDGTLDISTLVYMICKDDSRIVGR